MELLIESYVPILMIEGQKLVGLSNNEWEGYYGCQYVFEPNSEDFSFEYLNQLSGFDFIDDVCINAPFVSSGYAFAFTAKVGKIDGVMHFEISAYYSSTEWNEKVNLKHFIVELEKVIESCKDYNIQHYFNFENDENYVTIFSESSLDCKIGEVLLRLCKYLNKAHGAALGNIYFEDGFISQFKFPEEYKTAFVQYLTYFARFLENIGIKGDLTVSSKDKLTYLNFVPLDDNVALENIASALSTYLSLPGKRLELLQGNNDLESEVRFQQLVSVVEHLRSQLSLSKALLSVKDREIELLESNIKSTRVISSDIKEYWEPIEGVRITEYKGKFFEINIPKIISGIKDNFKRKK